MRMKQKYAQITAITLLTMVGSFIMDSVTLAQDSPWLRKADMATGRHSVAANVVDDKIYVIGGRYTDNLVNEYDPAIDTWTTKTSMPTARMLPASGVVNGKIYVIGGLVTTFDPALSTVEEYDPVTDGWAQKENMLTRRLGHSVSVVDGKIYVIGGMTSGSDFWSGMQNIVEVYDPESDSWTTKAPIPTGRVWLTTSVVNGKIYAIGGVLINTQEISTVEMYDPVSDTWTTKTPMPTARAGHVAAVVDGIIYVIGGGTHGPDPGGYSVVEAYDPVTDTWTKKDNIPVKRAFACADAIGGKIYVLGGIPTFADPHLLGEKTVYEYNPTKDLTTLINQVNVNKCFVQAVNDSVCITAKLNDPTGVTLFIEIQSPDQSPIDSMQLFDDGNHNDGIAGDSLYANVWSVSSSEEQQYYMDLQVTRIAAETIIHKMNNVASFTTIGPVVFDKYGFFTPRDTEPNPGDVLLITITLKNESSSATAAAVRARIVSLDTLATVNTDDYKPFGNIAPGNSKTTDSFYSIKISENCPGNTETQFILDITGNNFILWSDTFSVFVVNPTTGINLNENTPRQFILNQNYPNPFNPQTMITYTLAKATNVSLKIYDMAGRQIKTLVNKSQPSGEYSILFDASDLASGIYFYNLKTDSFEQCRRMLLLR